ncbi:MAG TPA: C-type lectin domain-containing protein, partial [Polyangiaceae bacterium]|nr:C-type lectin domain-containing protein [Polyangiaceae bacterium]
TGEGGAAGVPVSGGGGAGGTDDECLEMGEGGSGGAAAPYVCADYEFFPPGCTCADYQGHAYFFCGIYRNFENANTYCGYDGMQLAHVESSQENGWIRATAMARVPPLEYYWLGGTSDGTPDSWRWVDGTPFWSGNTPGEPVCGRFANWRSDAPSDPETTEPDQLCLYFTMDGWDDDVCNGDRMYVCEWY